MPFPTLQPPKRLLFAPGPTMVDPRVYKALAKHVVGCMDPFFFEAMDQIRVMLREVFGTRNEMTIAVSGTGSAGMETAIANFVEPGSKFAVFANGFFADRLAEMGRRQGASVARLEKRWGEVFAREEAQEFVRRERPDVVAFVHAETSTGALQDPGVITAAARESGALVIADAVTSLGALPVPMDKVEIDIAYSSSQKGLSCPPGLAPLSVSARAMERLKGRKSPVNEWYLDLKLLSEYFDGRKYHHTASASLFYALHEGLRVIEEEGLENRFKRHLRSHEALVRGVEALGLKMHVAEGGRIPNVNVVRVPENVDDMQVRKHLREKHGIDILGGLGVLTGKVFRIGLMGPLASEECVKMFLDAFGRALKASVK